MVISNSGLSFHQGLFKIFKSNGLSITVESNLILPDFLDVTFDLKSATCYPHRKPNNELLYINKHSNQPPSIINQIPSMISNRISENSSYKNHFHKAASNYYIPIKNSEFNENATYFSSTSECQTRKRKIIWFNPPYRVMWKQMLVKFLWDSLISIFFVTINTISYSTEITSN